MSKYQNIPPRGLARIIALIPSLFFFTNFIFPQNTSYSANTTPITGGAGNAAFGIGGLLLNSGNYNTASGYAALNSNTTGFSNTGHGFDALYSNTTGQHNTAIGYEVLIYSNGSENTGSGYRALFYNITGSNNTAVGDSAGLNNVGSNNVFLGAKSGSNETGSNKMYIGNDAAKTLIYGDFSTGQVLLGKPDATGYVFKGTRTVNVLGGILADSMRLAPNTNWADKVFNKDYPLKSLKELEQYISVNKHLPGIPTSGEVQSNGVNVGDMETKLLEKIEELTLYVLELKKENQQQQKEIDKIKGGGK